MARVQGTVAASAEQVWSVLADGWRYRDWVVGTREIRDVDAAWPQPGSQLHFTVGRGPLSKRDRTESRAAEPGRMLELTAHAWPAGNVRIRVELAPAPAGCSVVLEEHPLHGPAARLHNRVADWLLALRLRRMLALLGRCAAQ